MISNERKFYLKGILAKYKEIEDWAYSLSSSDDKEYVKSQGFSGIRLHIVLFIVLPLCWAIETGFNGVPYLMSFLKRRLKRVAPMERRIKKQVRSKKVIKLPAILKPCKLCNNKKASKKVTELFKVEKLKAVNGKGKCSRRNYLKRVKRRISKSLFKPIDEPVHMVFTAQGEQGPARSRRLRRMDAKNVRRVSRRSDILSGKRKLSCDSYKFFLFSQRWDPELPFFVYKTCKADQGRMLYQGTDLVPELFLTPFGYMFQRSFSMFSNKDWQAVGNRMMQMSRNAGVFYNHASSAGQKGRSDSSGSTGSFRRPGP